ncbi:MULTISPECIES: hypothetical protein [Weeksella]|uniref:Uncharacterized protein n=1 Tax=Weeksella virosa (strain ATCC 43766 / DSM 16922 / JCM 21250 / CCUG 30538 / CDC 9751 / IAM 14551 / NBRC 16016 / NCTC 11634 / CL345/78) TaxID=865938 RepID=F0P133_WEEVC|nr:MULTISPECIES: hypothetical protein [Weeksella]ADX68617.1 hypothetical protein Weevi_1933 [Weeksella virosa DSM 16922]MDK7375850.1 hypothetical protein [Weeksella virosa]MDK7676269.1 hypothetical protein [Weeksella virosa]OFM82348.1 hypothetical protein HMPREF2660_04570 [Weeksella sp. HMSC059D05]SUP54958.1 Uncharacterised protein [Weeksella virosa]
MNNILEVLDTKSKELGNTVSITTTGAALGIAVAKAIEKNQKVGALVGIGLGLLTYALFKPHEEKVKIVLDDFEEELA